jgi:hypothetical protein
VKRWFWLMRRFPRYCACDLVESSCDNVGIMHKRELKKSVWDRKMIVLYKVLR